MTIANTIWRYMNKNELFNELIIMQGLYLIASYKARKYLPREKRIELEKELDDWKRNKKLCKKLIHTNQLKTLIK